MAFHSFGGGNESLFVPLHMHGPMNGVRFYTRMKTLTARWPTGFARGSRVPYANHEVSLVPSLKLCHIY